MMTIVVALLVFGVLIFIHELGHFYDTYDTENESYYLDHEVSVDDKDYGEEGISDNCIYGNGKSSISEFDSITLCDRCYDIIYSSRQRFTADARDLEESV